MGNYWIEKDKLDGIMKQINKQMEKAMCGYLFDKPEFIFPEQDINANTMVCQVNFPIKLLSIDIIIKE